MEAVHVPAVPMVIQWSDVYVHSGTICVNGALQYIIFIVNTMSPAICYK